MRQPIRRCSIRWGNSISLLKSKKSRKRAQEQLMVSFRLKTEKKTRNRKKMMKICSRLMKAWIKRMTKVVNKMHPRMKCFLWIRWKPNQLVDACGCWDSCNCSQKGINHSSRTFSESRHFQMVLWTKSRLILSPTSLRCWQCTKNNTSIRTLAPWGCNWLKLWLRSYRDLASWTKRDW